MASLNCELPKLVLVNNYRQLSNAESFLSDVFEKEVCVEKLGFSNDAMRFVAVVYTTDTAPSESKIKELLDHKRIKIDMDNVD